jgi:hypothetical protein
LSCSRPCLWLPRRRRAPCLGDPWANKSSIWHWSQANQTRGKCTVLDRNIPTEYSKEKHNIFTHSDHGTLVFVAFGILE